MVRLVCVPQRAVDQAASTLEQGIEGAAKLLDEVAKLRPGITTAIARSLGMIDVPQTRRMACAIIANALVFHERIAGMHTEVDPLARVCGDGVDNPQGEVLAAWNDILEINYWAIFAIAKDILGQLPSGEAAAILRRLRDTAQSLSASGVDNAHDLTGRIFQQLIADRKYLATFYTLPASAALLARLAVAKMEGVDWSDPDAIGKLRVGDFACGTGALLSAVYDEIAARHERTGGDPDRAPPRDDGGGALRLRRHAVGNPHYGLHAVGSRTVDRIRHVAPLHDALRPDEGRQRDDRLVGAAPVLERADAVQHQRPGPAHRQRGRRDRRADPRRDTRRGLRPGDNEPALYPEHDS